MINRKSTYPIALDIGNRVIHAAQLKMVRGEPVVSGLFRREFTETAPDPPAVGYELTVALRKIRKSRMFCGRRVSAHMPAQYIQAFPITFQTAKIESLETALIREAGETLPFPVEEAVVDYPCITRLSSENTYKALVTAVRKPQVEHFIGMLKKEGMDTEIIDFRTSSLIRLHHHMYDSSANPIILCYIGYTKTVLSIVVRQHILAHRMFRWGTDTIADKLAANLEFIDGREKACELLTVYGVSRGRDKTDTTMVSESGVQRVVSQVVIPCIDELVYEFHTITGYVRHEEQNPRFDCIYLYGQAPRIKGLDNYLETTMQIPVKTINPLKHIPVNLRERALTDVEYHGTFSPVLGLAMRRVPWL